VTGVPPRDPVEADIAAAHKGLSLSRRSVARLEELEVRHTHSDLFASRCILIAVQRELHARQCANGFHSWVTETARLPARTPCDWCGELYGDPD
jgi:hypothetical protein